MAFLAGVHPAFNISKSNSGHFTTPLAVAFVGAPYDGPDESHPELTDTVCVSPPHNYPTANILHGPTASPSSCETLVRSIVLGERYIGSLADAILICDSEIVDTSRLSNTVASPVSGTSVRTSDK